MQSIEIAKLALSLVLLACAVGCCWLEKHPAGEQVVHLFVNPFCSTFRSAHRELRAINFQEEVHKKGMRVSWHPLLLAGNGCDNRLALAIVCAAERGEAAQLIDAVVDSPLSLESCAESDVDALLDNRAASASAIKRCMEAQGGQLLDQSFVVVDAAKVSVIPMYLPPGDREASPTMSFKQVLTSLPKQR